MHTDRPTRDAWGLGLAAVTAQRGTCCRRAVGCVLVDDLGHVLATGYNGVAMGQKHCNEMVLIPNPKLVTLTGKLREPEHWELEEIPSYPHACPGAAAPSGTMLDACQAIHAEQNALLQCRDVRAIHTCYVTVSPCVTCVKLLLNTGCRRIVFTELYPHLAALQLWEEAGRELVHANAR